MHHICICEPSHAHSSAPTSPSLNFSNAYALLKFKLALGDVGAIECACGGSPNAFFAIYLYIGCFEFEAKNAYICTRHHRFWSAKIQLPQPKCLACSCERKCAKSDHWQSEYRQPLSSRSHMSGSNQPRAGVVWHHQCQQHRHIVQLAAGGKLRVARANRRLTKRRLGLRIHAHSLRRHCDQRTG